MSDAQINIDDYIKGRMDAPAATAFESQIAADPALANEVQDQSQVMNALEAAGDQEVQAQIAAVSQQAQNESKPKADDIPTPKKDNTLAPTTNSDSGSAAIIKVIFKVDGKEAEVLSISYTLRQEVDNIGQPSGEVKGGFIKVSLGTLGAPSRFAWAITPDMRKSGEIDFIGSNGQTVKTLKFEDAYCIAYTEDYEAFTGSKSGKVTIKDGAKEHLTLSVRKISINGESHENTWI